MVQKVHVSIVLDQSGSMEVARFDVVDAINGYFAQIRTDADVASRLSVVTFNSQGIDTIRDRVLAEHCDDLSLKEYEPQGGTPLLDAVSYSVGILDCLSNKAELRILVILTDGLENGSRGTTRAELKLLLQRKQVEGWLLLYLGAGHDSATQAGQIGIAPWHTADFSLGRIGETAQILHAVGRRFLASSRGQKGRRVSAFTNEERRLLTDDAAAGRKRTVTSAGQAR
jgi:hypothetical protein